MSNSNPSQADIVLGVLQQFQGKWVAMPLLSDASGAYAIHSRISELRMKRGLKIDHKNERDGRVVKSFYRLVEQSQVAA